jgi:hypothetical protein
MVVGYCCGCCTCTCCCTACPWGGPRLLGLRGTVVMLGGTAAGTGGTSGSTFVASAGPTVPLGGAAAVTDPCISALAAAPTELLPCCPWSKRCPAPSCVLADEGFRMLGGTTGSPAAAMYRPQGEACTARSGALGRPGGGEYVWVGP